MGYIGKVKDTAGNTHLVGSTLYGTCSTGTDTAAKVVTCPDFSELIVGVTIHVSFTVANSVTGEMTLNVNNTGAKKISQGGATTNIKWSAGDILSFTYNGTNWCLSDYKDTKNTAGSTNTTSKVYLIGATEQASNGATYSNSNVYAQNGALHATTYNGYTLAGACAKAVDSSIGSTPGSNLPTSSAVANYVASAMADTANFQGTLVQTDSGNSGTKWTQAEIEAASYKKGWYWVCEVAGTYCGSVLEAGDMLFCVATKGSSYSASDFTAIQNNIETLTTTEVSTLWTNAVAVA